MAEGGQGNCDVASGSTAAAILPHDLLESARQRAAGLAQGPQTAPPARLVPPIVRLVADEL